jgi:S1 RNA binding domain protein
MRRPGIRRGSHRRPLTVRTRSLTLTPCRARSSRNEGEGAAHIAEIEVGAVIDGTVARITPYGAFLQLEDGRLGLVHISEVDRNYVKDVHDHLREGDVVQAKVVAIKEDGKIDLSIKALQDPAPPRARRGSDPEFEQMLKKFMRQSEERLVDYKRAVEHKRK